MKQLFLTSSIGTPGVAESIRQKIGHNKPLKTVFITTPVEVEDMTDDEWYQEDRKALTRNNFEIFDYTLTSKTHQDILKDLSSIECIYVSGGNEFWLKHQSNKCNFGQFVQDFVNKGGIYIGTSAGSIIASPDMTPALTITDCERCPEPITDLSGWNLVDFIPFPHWGSRWFKDSYLGERKEKMYEPKWKIILINDNQYIEVREDWYRIIDIRNEQ